MSLQVLYSLLLVVGSLSHHIYSNPTTNAASPSSTEPRAPWRQATADQRRPGEESPRENRGRVERCQEGGGSRQEELQEWAILLRSEVTETSLFGFEYRRTLDQHELQRVASSIADSNGLPLDVEHIQQFHGVFRLRYNLTGDGESWRVRRSNIHRQFASLDKSLSKHPLVVWSARQHCLTRQKRGFQLDFNDPMFDRQWHLVST